MKIVICAVPYSSNLGDGIIYENIRYLLLEHIPDANISALDIAGRDDFSITSVSKKSLIGKIPKFLRSYAVCSYFSLQYFLRWRRKWAKQLADADLIVIGGGQLLLDVHLNFPIKLFWLSSVIKSIGKSGKVAIFGVGVSKTMSTVGIKLFGLTWRKLLPIYSSTRDKASSKNLERFLNTPLNIRVTPDPGIYSLKTFATYFPQRPVNNVLGICISSPLELNQEKMQKQSYSKQIGEYFQQLAKQAMALGYQVCLFTNGAPEDEVFKNALYAGLNSQIHNLQRPTTPAQLVANIGQCDYVIAHRLHANIVAYALDIPSIGLNWDNKVQSFFELTNRGKFFIAASVPDVMFTLDLLGQIREVRNNVETKMQLIQQLKIEIANLITHLDSADFNCSIKSNNKKQSFV